MSEPIARVAPAPLPPGGAAAALFAHSRDLLVFTDWSSVIVDVNPAFERAVGAPRADLIGRSAYELIHPEDQGVARRAGEALRTVGHGERSFRIRAADGQWRWLEGRAQALSPTLLMATLRDVTEEREAALRRVLDEAPFASAILDTELRYINVSAAWRALFRQPTAAGQGVRFGASQAPAVQRRLIRAAKRALTGGVVDRAMEHLADAEGRAVVMRWQARPWRTGAGAVRGVLVYATDITDVVAVRRRDRANAQRLKLALEAADASVFEIDFAAKRFWSDPQFGRLAGRGLSYAEATGVWPTIHADDRAAVAGFVAGFDTHEPTPLEARMDTARGPRWTRSHLRIQHDAQGRPRRAVGLIQDIDAQKRQELALEAAERRANVAAEAKSNFLANISHEIRTPMNGVLGVLQLIKREHLDADEARLLDEALASGRMLSEMLDDLLDFSKIETGQFELHAEPLDPTAVLVGVASLLQPAASAKGLTMSAVAAPDLGLVRADPMRLRQALYNLVGNAVKFTPQGSIDIRLTRRVTAEGQPRLRFEVQDTGVGVDESAQATLFERFEQADSSATRRFGGSGLGLAITKRLAEMMGGAVGFTSTPGQGSTFWIEIDGAAAEPAEAAPEPADIADFRVLLVEDNPTNRLVISKILEALGVEVDTAEDGAEGVALASKGGYDLVLMDIQMPGMDGIEAARRIRALDGPLSATPIVAVTANVLAHQRSSYVDAGIDGVVAKPVSAGALMTEICRVADRQAAA